MPEKVNVDADKLSTAGMLAISTVVLIQLLSKDSLDGVLWISVYSFAVAIPCLAGLIFIIGSQSMVGMVETRWNYKLIVWHGNILAFVGLGAVFWHFHCSVGIAFIAVSILLLFACNKKASK